MGPLIGEPVPAPTSMNYLCGQTPVPDHARYSPAGIKPRPTTPNSCYTFSAATSHWFDCHQICPAAKACTYALSLKHLHNNTALTQTYRRHQYPTITPTLDLRRQPLRFPHKHTDAPPTKHHPLPTKVPYRDPHISPRHHSILYLPAEWCCR
jgi:hypothetical protein